MDQQQRYKVLQSIMWDYSIPVAETEKLLAGIIDKAGHYNREKLFVKILSGLPWFTVIQLLPVEQVKKCLDEIIGRYGQSPFRINMNISGKDYGSFTDSG
jgi:hypothetical protein